MTDPNPQPQRRPLWRRFAHWLLALKGSPRQIAMGLAVGVFFGCSPLMGLQIALALALATALGVNRPAAVAGTLVSNPFTSIPLYAFTYRLGHAFVPGRSSDSITAQLRAFFRQDNAAWWDLVGQARELLRLGEELLIPLTIGGAIAGLWFGTLGYALCRLTLRLLGRRSHPGLVA
jgi:uncharacterized protein (DUF2062 family)